jgi:hypothetical protein
MVKKIISSLILLQFLLFVPICIDRQGTDDQSFAIIKSAYAQVQGKDSYKDLSDNSDVAKKFVTLLSQNKYFEAVNNFSFPMKSMVPAEKLKHMWENSERKYGKFEKITNVKPVKGADFVFVNCKFKKKPAIVKLKINAIKEVDGIFIVPASK